MKKNLVMGAAAHYDWNTLEPFVNSFKKNCPSADLLLFVDDLSDFTRAQLIKAGVIIKDFPADMKSGVPNNTRWKIFADFLEKNGDAYEQILTTDTRDVIFQGDVFEKFSGYKNYLGYATEPDDIGGSKTGSKQNYGWFVDAFGKEEADKLLDKKIICDGTVIGTIDEIKTFAQRMRQAVFAVEKRVTFRIHDQSVANYLIYNNFVPIENFIESDVESGAIFTMALAEGFSLRGDKILRGDGGIPAVVHQYDRYEHLVKLVDEIYRDKNFQFDEGFTDTRSVIEQTTSLLQADRIGEATKLFLKNFLGNADLRNCSKALINLWKVALKKPLTQTLELLELAVQNAIQSLNFRGIALDEVCRIFNRAEKLGHPVDLDFKSHIAGGILKTAEFHLNAKNFDGCLYGINLVESLNMPLDKDFYLFAAKANRLAGNKDAALAAYKKVLEFD